MPGNMGSLTCSIHPLMCAVMGGAKCCAMSDGSAGTHLPLANSDSWEVWCGHMVQYEPAGQTLELDLIGAVESEP
jgi:hypothetical protein